MILGKSRSIFSLIALRTNELILTLFFFNSLNNNISFCVNLNLWICVSLLIFVLHLWVLAISYMPLKSTLLTLTEINTNQSAIIRKRGIYTFLFWFIVWCIVVESSSHCSLSWNISYVSSTLASRFLWYIRRQHHSETSDKSTLTSWPLRSVQTGISAIGGVISTRHLPDDNVLPI